MEPLVDIPLDAISPSPSNPRRRMEPPVLDQLAASIRAQGILSPIIVRPMPDGAPTEYELVAGERRWRAARLAGLTAIRAQVRELDDRAVLEVQIAENRDRADVHPLDEADAYRRLRDQHHVEVEEIAARAGHPLGYIRQRLSLSQLGAEGRDALLADRISLGIAQKIARLPAGDQAEAVTQFTKPRAGGGWTVADAGAWIRSRYYLSLAKAPFDATSVRLLPGAPPCAACPKNTASQGDLFGDLDAAHCTDARCYADKTAAQWARDTRDAAEAGRLVATIEESNVALAGGYASKGYVRADDCPEEYGGKKTWLELLRKAPPPVVIARNPVSGTPTDVIRPADLKAAITSTGLKRKAAKDAPDEPSTAGAFAERTAIDDAARPRQLEAVAVAAHDQVVVTDEEHLALARWEVAMVAQAVDPLAVLHVAQRRGIVATDARDAALNALLIEAEGLDLPRARSLFAELLCAAFLVNGQSETLNALGRYLGVNVLALRQGIVEERAAKKAAEDAAAAPKKRAKKGGAA